MSEATRHETESMTDGAREEAQRLADEARREAGQVTDEVKEQGREFIGQTQDRLREEADRQAGRTASGLKSMSSELRSMAENSEQPQSDVATWVRRGADGIESFADRLDREGMDGVVRDVSDFARRNPTTFLVTSFGLGLLAGRLMKNIDGGTMTQSGERYRTGGYRASQPTSREYGTRTPDITRRPGDSAAPERRRP